MASYQYQPLSQRQIRLLMVETYANEPRFDLIAGNIDDIPQYETLSYTWGSSQLSSKIVLNDGGYIPISNNLFVALKHTIKHMAGAFLWIDQICINQKDMKERNHQVSLMRDIYRNSERVLIWLGEEESKTKYIRELIDAIGSQPGSTHLCFVPGAAEKLKAMKEKIRPLIDLSGNPENPGALRREAITDFLNRPWFQRVWVFQEFVVPKSVAMLVGSTCFHVSDIDNVMHAVCELEYEGRGYKGTLSKTTIGFSTLGRMLHSRIDYHDSSKKVNVLEILCLIGESFKATDTRDFIYAFLGPFSDASIDIKADYALTAEYIFTAATRALIEGTNSLGVFCYAQGQMYRREGIPSWSPDWSKPQPIPMPVGDVAQGCTFAACGAFSYRPQTVSSQSYLAVQGKVVDTIKSVVVQCAFENYYFMDDIKKYLYLAYHVKQLRPLEDAYAAPVTRERVLKAILVDGGAPAGKTRQHERLTPEFVADLLLCYDNWPRINSNDTSLVGLQKQKDDLYELQQRALHAQKKRVVYTEKGFIGLAPRDVRPGDVVCILHGSKAPVVLRPLNGRWALVGPCWYENGMHGELVTWSEDEADSFELL